MSRSKRANIAKETMAIMASGYYQSLSGNRIDIEDLVRNAIRKTRTYSPADLDSMLSSIDATRDFENITPNYVVENATTFAAVKAILNDDPTARVLSLNFASAKNAGGGFVNGSQAQEEALCRASALYDCINPQRTYYDTNRSFGNPLYTDTMIYSPQVPVFRDDNDELIESPYTTSIVTAPAVNAGALTNSHPHKVGEIEDVMLGRIDKLLAIAVEHNYKNLVLGAWGCGVFRNAPADMARMFRQRLTSERFANAFNNVYFGVLDFTKDESTYRPFAEAFRDI